MKTSQNSKYLKYMFGFLVLILLQACGKSEETTGAGRVTSNAAAVVNTNACAADDQMKIGRVYDDTNGAVTPTFNDQLKNFISGFSDPNSIEYVSGLYYDNTRVEITGSLKFDGNGNVIPAQSQIRLAVYDSRSIYSHTQPFGVTLSSTSSMTMSGTYNRSNGHVDVQFTDPAGTVTLVAKYDGKFLSGSIHFNNKTAYDGSVGKSGRLGAFYISACAIL